MEVRSDNFNSLHNDMFCHWFVLQTVRPKSSSLSTAEVRSNLESV